MKTPYESHEKIIAKYQRYLKTAEDNLKYLELTQKKNTQVYAVQKVLLPVWRMVIKDFKDLAEKMNDDLKKK